MHYNAKSNNNCSIVLSFEVNQFYRIVKIKKKNHIIIITKKSKRIRINITIICLNETYYHVSE